MSHIAQKHFLIQLIIVMTDLEIDGNRSLVLWWGKEIRTIDNRAITEYKLVIKVCDRGECAKYDPFGLCYVDDCMSCPNARVKITREDGDVMRDDFKNKKNTGREDTIWSYRRMLERDSVELFEEMYDTKFSKWQKWYLKKLFNKLKDKK